MSQNTAALQEIEAALDRAEAFRAHAYEMGEFQTAREVEEAIRELAAERDALLG